MPSIPEDLPAEQSVRHRRAQFQADFAQAAADGDECLSTEEILALQSGVDLDSTAKDHLAHCNLCSSIRQAIDVDPILESEFLTAARSARPAPRPDMERRRVTVWDRRLVMAGLSTFASIAMIIFITKTQVPLNSLEPPHLVIVQTNPKPQTPEQPPQPVEMSIQKPLRVPMKTASVSVRDYAPEVATALIVSQSTLSVPADAKRKPAEEAQQKLNAIVLDFMKSDTPSAASFDQLYTAFVFHSNIASAQTATIVSDRSTKTFELTFTGTGFRAVARVPEPALREGLFMKQILLDVAQPKPLDLNGELNLGNGIVARLVH